MQIDKSEFYKLLEKADGSFLIEKVEKEKEKKIWIATDWLSTRPVYYAVTSNGIMLSSCFWSVLRFFKEMKYPNKIK
jgi:asparagine synthetase B (glutamine-hydrolysing)